MNVTDAIKNRRSIRKFTGRRIGRTVLTGLVELARYTATGANMQPLKYMIIDSVKLCNSIFPHIKWAAYLPDGAPKEGERPPAYIAVFGDTTIKAAFECDAGAAITTMMLGAEDTGLATCWLGAINREKISQILDTPQNLKLLYLLAVGYPAQTSRAVEMTDSVKYWENPDGSISVPKRSLEEILL